METLFRVWDKTDAKMLYFNGIFNKHPFTETSTFPQYESFPKDHELIVMGYTGFKDKNGIKIFEKDIVEAPMGRVFDDNLEVVWGGKYNYSAFGLQMKRKDRADYELEYTFDFLNKNTAMICTVIGNMITCPEKLIGH